MAFNYSIKPAENFIWLEWNGAFDLEAIKYHTNTMYEDPLYKPHFHGFCDARFAEFNLNDSGILKVQEYIANHPLHPTGPWAVLVEEPLQTAYAMIYESVETAVHPTKVFCTKEAAMKWLSEFKA